MAVKTSKSDTYIVYQLLKKELPEYKFKFDKSEDPLDDTIWVESDELTTYMTLDDGALWIEDDCQKHLECNEYNHCEPDCFVVKLADPDFTNAVGSILYAMETRREAISIIKKNQFAIVDRDIRISQLEQLLKKNKIRIPKHD